MEKKRKEDSSRKLLYVTFASIQNNCSSLEAFNPEFKIGFNYLIFSASLNKIISQFLCLSIVSALCSTKLMRAVLKSYLSLFWIRDDNKQRYDVCMGSSNIRMTDLDEKLSKPLINNNTIKLYARYVDHTLFVIKRENVVYRIFYIISTCRFITESGTTFLRLAIICRWHIIF